MNRLTIYIDGYVKEAIKDVKAAKTELERIEIALYYTRCLESDVKGGIVLCPKKSREEALKALPYYKRRLMDAAYEKPVVMV